MTKSAFGTACWHNKKIGLIGDYWIHESRLALQPRRLATLDGTLKAKYLITKNTA